MKQKKILALVLALSVFVTLLAGCGAKKDSTAAADTGKTGGAVSTGETVKLTIAHIGALESPSNLTLEEFIRLVDSEYENQLLADKESEDLEKMKEAGVTVHEPDLTEWIAAVQPMFDQYVDSWGQDLFDRIQAAAN